MLHTHTVYGVLLGVAGIVFYRGIILDSNNNLKQNSIIDNGNVSEWFVDIYFE